MTQESLRLRIISWRKDKSSVAVHSLNVREYAEILPESPAVLKTQTGLSSRKKIANGVGIVWVYKPVNFPTLVSVLPRPLSEVVAIF